MLVDASDKREHGFYITRPIRAQKEDLETLKCRNTPVLVYSRIVPNSFSRFKYHKKFRKLKSKANGTIFPGPIILVILGE